MFGPNSSVSKSKKFFEQRQGLIAPFELFDSIELYRVLTRWFYGGGVRYYYLGFVGLYYLLLLVGCFVFFGLVCCRCVGLCCWGL